MKGRVTLCHIDKYASVKLRDPGCGFDLNSWFKHKEPENSAEKKVCLLMAAVIRLPNTRVEQAIEHLSTCLATESYVSMGA